MTVRWVAFVIFVFAVLGIGLWRYHKVSTQTAGYIAVRKLPVNTRIASNLWILQKGDTPFASWSIPKPEDLLGRYVRHDIEANSAIVPDDLSESPQLTLAKDRVPLAYNLADAGPLASYLNKGAQVYVCDQDNLSCTGGPYEVETLLGKLDAQLVLIDLSSKDANELRKIKKPMLVIATLPQ